MQLGSQGAGVVVAVGSGVKSLRVGDAVYGMHHQHPLFPLRPPGFCSEYAVTHASSLCLKPPGLSFDDAAGLAGHTLTAYQALKLAMAAAGVDSLEGKTVFMTAALSATGAAGAQMIKHGFGAARLISTVSTPKLPLVEQYLPCVVDQVVDYTTQDVVRAVGRGTVDFVYNTQWDLVGTFPLLKPATGVVVSIASIPPPHVVKSLMGSVAPRWMLWLLGAAQYWYAWKLRGTDVKLVFQSGDAGKREDVERTGEMIAQGKIKAVSTVVPLEDIAEVRRRCEMVATGKGGLGALVIKIV